MKLVDLPDADAPLSRSEDDEPAPTEQPQDETPDAPRADAREDAFFPGVPLS